MSDSQSNSENNMVNLYNSRLKEFHIDDKLNNTREKLDQWRDDCHKAIDELYQRKLEELNSYIDELKLKYEEKKTQIQTNLLQLNNQENLNLIKTIEDDLNDIEQTSLQIHIRSLNINENYIFIEKQFDVGKLSSVSSKFFYTDQSSSAIASNQRYLLMHQHPYLCLIDQDLKIIKQNIWSYDWIRDICWSNILHSFILITANQIYYVDEKLEYQPLLQKDIKQNWFSCTSSDQYLYLSTCEWGSSIYQLSLSPSIDFVYQWKSPLTCENSEGINDIKYNNETIALMIKDSKENKKRIDLKSIKEFSIIWSLPLGDQLNIRLITCCPINDNEWLIIDGTNSKIYQITKDGKFKNNIRSNSIPYRANLFSSNILAIAAEYDLNLCQI